MSQFDSQHPYAPPIVETVNAPRPIKSTQLPTFVMVVMILELIWLSLRLLTIPIGILGLTMAMEAGNGVFIIGLELVAFTLMVLLGFPAAIGILLKKNWVLYPAIGKVIATVASYLCAIVGALTTPNQFAPAGESPEAVFAGMIIGLSCMIIFRAILLGLYCVAVYKYQEWLGQQPSPRQQVSYH